MRLLEDTLTKDEYTAIESVHEAITFRFGKLIEIAGLDPKSDLRYANLKYVDFRGSDLRGYDLTGADLRFSIKDESTQIDETTILEGALIRWVNKHEIEIVQKMLQAESAKSRKNRRIALSDLVNDYNSEDHINVYLMRSVRNADSIEKMLDFAEYLVGPVNDEDVASIAEKFSKLISKKRNASRRTSKLGGQQIAGGKIAEEISHSRSEVLIKIFESLVKMKLHQNSKQAKNSFDGFEQVTMDDLSKAANLLSEKISFEVQRQAP